MKQTISDAEFVLLLLISEMPHANGYQLRQTVENRGIEEWAGVSSSSIYVVLKKLEDRKFVASSLDVTKTSKGPKGKVFEVLEGGKPALHNAILEGLSERRENDRRFMIALSGIELIGYNRSIMCLRRRIEFLNETLCKICAKADTQKGIPLSGKLLFCRTESVIKSEIHWVETAINSIRAIEESNRGFTLST